MLDDDAVQLAIRAAYREGERPPAPITAHELRSKRDGRLRARVGLKLPVALVAGAVLILVLFTAGPLGTRVRGPGSTGHATGGEASYSAYGLQLSVPSSWRVRYFPPCPQQVRPGGLDIGRTGLVYNCPIYDGRGTLVEMYAGAAPQGWTDGPPRDISVNGIHILSGSSDGASLWYVPAAHAFLWGRGAGSEAVLATLRPATRSATRAPGMGGGTEYVYGLRRAPVSGPVRIEDLATGRTRVVRSFEGRFTVTAPAGTYRLSGSAGDAPCAPVRVSLTSGTYTVWPPIECQGA